MIYNNNTICETSSGDIVIKCEVLDNNDNTDSETDEHIETGHINDINFEAIKTEYNYETRQKSLTSRLKSILSIEHIEEDIESVNLIKALRATNDHKIIGYRCKWSECDYVSGKQDMVESHINLNHTNHRPFKCNECDSCFVNTTGLKTHKRKVHCERRFECDFPNCEYAAKTNYKLNRHKVIHSSCQFVCDFPQCEYTGKSKQQLTAHKTIHSSCQYTCDFPECEYTGKSKQLLSLHRRMHSSRRFSCDFPECEYSGKTKRMLRVHQVIHLAVKPFVCEWPGCGKRFNYQSKVTEHRRRIHLREYRYACDWPGCDRVYASTARRAIHKRKHRNEKPYTCDWPGCDYRYLERTKLRSHRVKHTGDRKFVCSWPECEKKFATRWNLSKHLRVHRGEKAFKCEFPDCQRQFTERGNMVKHMNTHNKNKKSK